MKKSKTFYALTISVVIIVILYLLHKPSTNKITNNQQAGNLYNVSVPAFNLPPRGDIILPTISGYPPINIAYGPVNIPGLPSSNFTNYDMRSACACGGSTVPIYQPSIPQTAPTVAKVPLPTYIPTPTYSYGSNFITPTVTQPYRSLDTFAGGMNSYNAPAWWEAGYTGF